MELWKMSTMMRNSVVVLGALLVIFTIPSQSVRRESTRQCGGNDVCRTMMKYKDDTIVDEGENCLCREGPDACSKDWEEGAAHTLTWQHYERAHWAIQYKFCTSVFANKIDCEANKTAAVVETDVTSWQPRISQPRCVCKNNAIPKSMGWKKEGAVWKYFYSCDKNECPYPGDTLLDTSACVKIFVDQYRAAGKVLEMKFLCNCPDGYLCPAKYDDKVDAQNIYTDSTGSYVIKSCETIQRKDD